MSDRIKYKIIYNDNPVVNLLTGKQDRRQARHELVRDDGTVMIVSKHKDMLSEYAKMSGVEVQDGRNDICRG